MTEHGPQSEPSWLHPPGGPQARPVSRRWGPRPISRRQLVAVAAGAAVVLWALAGAPGVVLAIALGTVIVVRVLGAVLLPRLVREHSLVIAAVAGLVVLLGQSRWWAIALTAGLAVAVLALSQRVRLRVLALFAGAVLVVCGVTGWVVDAVTAKARLDAYYRAAGDVARGQMLPHQPDEVPGDLARAIAIAVLERDSTCLLFTAHGQDTFRAVYPAADCRAALRAAGAAVTAPEDYHRIDRSTVHTTRNPDGTVLVDACAVRWHRNALDHVLYGAPRPPDPGPQLGRMVVTRAYQVAWQIHDFQPCPSR